MAELFEETSTDVLKIKFHSTLDKNKVVCTYCNDELCFHQSVTGLKNCLRTKHIIVNQDSHHS